MTLKTRFRSDMTPVKEAVRELWHALRMGRMPKRPPKPTRAPHRCLDEEPKKVKGPERPSQRPFSADLVRAMRASSETHADWARRLCVAESTVRKCRNRVSYRDIE